MSLFDRHKPSGNFFPIGAPPVVREEVRYVSTGVSEEDFYTLLAKNERNADAARHNALIGLERRAINAGLRAALREALKALREQNPKHSLLDKAYRQKLFNAYEKKEQERIGAERISNKLQVPSFTEKPDEHIMEDIF